MANRWKIPKSIEQKIRKRDTRCVYCGTNFASNAKERATWEHIDNDAGNISEENICLCCNSCNASKRTIHLQVWLKSHYCLNNNINERTVAKIVRLNLGIR